MKKIYFFCVVAFLLGNIVCFAQYTKLFDFTGTTNGRGPWGHFVSDGTYLYGLAEFGGANNAGTIFKIKPDGSGFVKLLDFSEFTYGSLPRGSLYTDSTWLYAMTYDGGFNGAGTVFKIKTDGSSYTRLLDFAGSSNGSDPEIAGSLITDGSYLYGTTTWGGINNLGTVFKVRKDGSGYAKLVDFAGSANGSHPFGTVYSDGAFLYGMTVAGGVKDSGIVYKVSTDGNVFAKVLDFTGVANGGNPYGSLLSDGTFLYGMAHAGGNYGKGIVFKMMPDGTGFAIIHHFAGAPDGGFPLGSLILQGGYLYGMTTGGGPVYTDGIIFQIKPDGTDYQVVYNFQGYFNADGSFPRGDLFSDGAFLYGMTNRGGSNDFGVAFKHAIVTGIDNQSLSNNLLSVFPNPSNGILHIGLNKNISDGLLNIFTAIGEKVYSEIFSGKQETITCKLNPGIYFVQIQAPNFMETRKLIVAK